MAKKHIISVNFDIPHDDVELVDYDEKKSLADGDFIIFNPSFPWSPSKDYQGESLLDENHSLKLRKSFGHWRVELSDAIKTGKTIIIIASQPNSYLVYSGTSQRTGTGRNQTVTKDVKELSSYGCLPLLLSPIIGSGQRTKFVGEHTFFKQFWDKYGTEIEYKCALKSSELIPLITSIDKSKIVAGFKKFENGNLIAIPEPDFNKDEYSQENGEGGYEWNEKGFQIGHEFISCLISMVSMLNDDGCNEPEPLWVKSPEYISNEEVSLVKEIEKIDNDIEQLKRDKDGVSTQLHNEQSLKKLLYAKGSELEKAIIEALTILGFEAEQFANDSSEFDAVFSSPEGNFLGEAEGRDNKAIETTKIRQLISNTTEYFEIHSIYPKGVLFGNPERITKIGERKHTFTDKAATLAKLHKIALVLTSDLFFIASYIKENPDSDFSSSCRKAILTTEGEIVVFPPSPQKLKKHRATKSMPASTRCL